MNDSANLPVRWEEELERYGKQVATLERPALSQISLRGGVMTYQGQNVPNNKLDVIVVASVFENRWFKNRFDPNKRENPNCFALSIDGKDMVPHEVSPERQSETCEDCPLFQWGSDPNGGRGKACKQVRRLALLPASFLATTDANLSTLEMALLSIPVTSGRNWANYVHAVSAEYKRPYWAVLTEIAVVPHKTHQFEVKFTTKNIVNEQYLKALLDRVNSAQAVLMSPYDYSGAEASEEVAPPSKAGKKY